MCMSKRNVQLDMIKSDDPLHLHRPLTTGKFQLASDVRLNL
jgi:hypothetical protein